MERITISTTASKMTVEHLGSGATEDDLREFRDLVARVQARHHMSEQDATDAVWGDGDWTANAARLLKSGE